MLSVHFAFTLIVSTLAVAQPSLACIPLCRPSPFLLPVMSSFNCTTHKFPQSSNRPGLDNNNNQFFTSSHSVIGVITHFILLCCVITSLPSSSRHQRSHLPSLFFSFSLSLLLLHLLGTLLIFSLLSFSLPLHIQLLLLYIFPLLCGSARVTTNNQ